MVERIIKAVERLQSHPLSGRVVPEAAGVENIREVIVAAYRVIYRVSTLQVDILTVHHGARLLDPSKLK